MLLLSICVLSSVAASDATCASSYKILTGVGVCKGENTPFQGIGSVEACCAKCTGNCTGWTFHENATDHGDNCFITSAKYLKQGNTPGTTSGVAIVPTPPPTPAKPTLPPSPPAAGKQPHILMILVDDWGWANVGYHRKEYNDTTTEVQTPNIDQLVAEGIELDRNYVFKFCSPSRSSLQSGRLPVHVNVKNDGPEEYNPNDPVSGFAAIPRNMTGMAVHMKKAGYATHQCGKWDAGMATPDHSPQGRGYDTSFGYFHHANDYWRFTTKGCPGVVDSWMTDGPATPSKSKADTGRDIFTNGSTPAGGPTTGSVQDYEEWKFAQYVVQKIREHDPEIPLFFNYDFHIVHEPLDVPEVYEAAQQKLTTYPDFNGHRTTYHAMVKFMDDVFGNLTSVLKSKGMWENTLMVVSSDNGGPSFSGSSHTANNYPLKGTKMNNWEGGVRVNGFVSGGFLQTAAPKMIGKRLEGFTHVCDWYATFAALAGVDPTDTRAAVAGLPPIDSLDLWPYLSGKVGASPRTEIHMDTSAMIAGQYKILTGDHSSACWMGPHYPNGTHSPDCQSTAHCGNSGCLFDIFADPFEYRDLASDPTHANTLKTMLGKLADANTRFFDPVRGGNTDNLACKVATHKYGGYYGPFLS